MNNSPIETVICNLCDVDKTIQWTGGGSIWVGKKSSVTVPYDVWTAADRKQRESLIAACQQKSVKLTLRVLQSTGEIMEIDYDPSVLMKPRAVVTPQPTKTAQFVQSMQEDDKMHTINATSSTGGSAAAAHYGATKTKDDEGVGAHAEGASMEGFQQDTDTDVTSTKKALEEQPNEEAPEEGDQNDVQGEGQDEGAADDIKTDGATPDLTAVKELFEARIAAKQWDSALELLIDTFGADKVTFTTRTLMSLKDFDAVVTKYNLQ
jgi:hypothetical protein